MAESSDPTPPNSVSGVTFLAFGNGAPDIFAAIASVLSTKTPKFGLALGALLGAGIFLSTVIVAVVTLLRPFHVMRRPVLRDLGFYLFTVLYIFFILYQEKISLAESIGFIAMYIVYAVVVAMGRYIRKRMIASSASKTVLVKEEEVEGEEVSVPSEEKILSDSRRYNIPRVDSVIEEATWRYNVFHSDSLYVRTVVMCRLVVSEFWKAERPFSNADWEEAKLHKKIILLIRSPIVLLFNITIPTVNLEMENNNWSQPLIIIQCILAPVFLLFPIRSWSVLGSFSFSRTIVRDHPYLNYVTQFEKCLNYMVYGEFPLWIIILMADVLLAAVIFVTSDLDQPPGYHKLFAYAGFVMSVVWIYTLATEVVGIITMIGVVSGAPEEILGLTLLAWSNSLGDFFADLSVARQGYPRMAISACFGGPVFNILLGIGVPFTIATIGRKGHFLPVHFNSLTMVLVGFLLWSLLSSLILLPVSKFHATRPYACYLLIVYISFLFIASLTATNVIRIPVPVLHG